MPESKPSSSQGCPPIAILGVPFDNVTTAETLEIIAEMIKSGRPHYAATANVDFVVQASEDVELRRILFDAHLVLADGQPIVWASAFLGNPLRERVTGSGLIPLLLALAEKNGWRVFFLGGTQESVAAAAEKTRAKHPRLQLVGAYSPPFKLLLEMDHTDILRRVREVKPDILLVAFGCPKQEKWINMHLAAAGVPFSVGVGATIDFLAGTFKRAPAWMQKTGTEWIFRLLQEPGRLAGRYGKDLRVFGFAILRQWWQMRRRKPRIHGAGTATISVETSGLSVFEGPSRLDAASVRENGDAWRAAVTRGNVVFNLAATEFADSTGIGALIRLRKLSRENGRAFVLAAPPPGLTASFKLMRLEGFFAVEPGLDAARSRVVQELAGAEVSKAPPAADCVIRWIGEATAANVDEVRAKTELELTPLPPGARAAVDLSKLSFADSSGIGLMLGLKKTAQRREVTVVFRNPNESVRNVLRMTRLESFLLEEGG